MSRLRSGSWGRAGGRAQEAWDRTCRRRPAAPADCRLFGVVYGHPRQPASSLAHSLVSFPLLSESHFILARLSRYLPMCRSLSLGFLFSASSCVLPCLRPVRTRVLVALRSDEDDAGSVCDDDQCIFLRSVRRLLHFASLRFPSNMFRERRGRLVAC